MERTQSGTTREFIKRRDLLGTFDQAAKICDQSAMQAAGLSELRPTAFAGPEARTLGLGRGHMEVDVLRPRRAGAAGWPTVHAEEVYRGGSER